MWVGCNDIVKPKHSTSLNTSEAGAGEEQLFLISSGAGAGAMKKQYRAPEQELEHFQHLPCSNTLVSTITRSFLS